MFTVSAGGNEAAVDPQTLGTPSAAALTGLSGNHGRTEQSCSAAPRGTERTVPGSVSGSDAVRPSGSDPVRRPHRLCHAVLPADLLWSSGPVE